MFLKEKDTVEEKKPSLLYCLADTMEICTKPIHITRWPIFTVKGKTGKYQTVSGRKL